MKFKYLLLALFCMSAFIGAGPRQMLRGYPLGSVVSVDKDTGAVSVDLGARDGVMKGIGFVVVDKGGREMLSITAKEVYSDLFWSGGVNPQASVGVRSGMQVRWLFTPEVSGLLNARKQGTAEAYREFITRFPGSLFIPEMIKGMPDATMKELNPDYYQAWKEYTKDAFQAVIKKYPGTGFDKAAEGEIKSIESYEAELEKIRKEREKAAAAAAQEQKRREAIDQKVREREEKPLKVLTPGKLENKSSVPVRFVFEPAGEIPETRVQPNSQAEVRAASGSYNYKVYKVEENQLPGLAGDTKPQPLKEGAFDIRFDAWDLIYP